jgi:hypothetical protein
VLDGIRICPEGVLIDCLGMSFSLVFNSVVEGNIIEYGTDDDGDEVYTVVYLPLDAIVALLNERLVFS